jgi:hypothetical protein
VGQVDLLGLRLKEKIQDELASLTLQCEKCRCEANDETVNEDCPAGASHSFRH